MKSYLTDVEDQMVRFYSPFNERDRRQYAVIESMKLGHGGVQYISNLLGLHRKTIVRGMTELNSEEQLITNRIRKKGGRRRNWVISIVMVLRMLLSPLLSTIMISLAMGMARSFHTGYTTLEIM